MLRGIFNAFECVVFVSNQVCDSLAAFTVSVDQALNERGLSRSWGTGDSYAVRPSKRGEKCR